MAKLAKNMNAEGEVNGNKPTEGKAPPASTTVISLSTVMDQEQERIAQELSEIDEEISELVEEQGRLRVELRALEAYANIKAGKVAEVIHRTPRGPRTGGKREGILDLLRANPEGLTRSLFLEKMGAKGDEAAQRSISNALSVMKKAGTVQHDETTGEYRLAS